MSIAYRAHSDWIAQRVNQFSSPVVKGRWPVLGENLRFVLDHRNIQLFDDNGIYVSEGWMKVEGNNLVLGTMNSSGQITHFELQDRTGTTLCKGVAGAANKIPNVDYCWTAIPPGSQFRVVAQGTHNEFLQYVVTTHPAGTSFEQ
jgi:hypothetical protein